MKSTAHDEAEALRARSEAWFRNYVLTGIITEEELLAVPDPADKPKEPFTREPDQR